MNAGMREVSRAAGMMESMRDESAYLYQRAEQELELAQRSEHAAAVKAHYMLAGYYLDRVYGPPAPDLASDRS